MLRLLIFLALRPLILAEEKQPTVLLISIEDLNDRFGCLGGHPMTKMPNIDELAESGALITNHIARLQRVIHRAQPAGNSSASLISPSFSVAASAGHMTWIPSSLPYDARY